MRIEITGLTWTPEMTYSKYCWVVWKARRLRFLDLLWNLFNAQVFHVTTAENNIFIDVVRTRKHLFVGAPPLSSV